MVDAPDSKSGGAKAPCRFEPDLRYQEVPAKPTKNQNSVKRPGENVGPLYTNYYTNALKKRLFHRFGGALLHVREHVRVGVERDGDAGVTLWGTRLLPGGGNFEQSTRRFTSERAGEIVTLRQVAPELSQAVELLLRLYTFGDNLEA